MTRSEPRAGDRFIAYPHMRPASRVFISVTRVAKDKSWADIKCQTWAVGWSKRQKIKDGGLPAAIVKWWDQIDLDEQQVDHMLKLESKGSEIERTETR